MASRWRYLLGELRIGLGRNPLMTFATILTVTFTLALLGAGLLAQGHVNYVRELFYAQVEVGIFLQDGISQEQLQSLENDLRASPVVSDVIYESKDQAYQHFQEIFADDPNLLASVTPDILPASFRVKLTDPEEFAVIQSQFAGYPGVEEVVDQREVLEQLFQIMRFFRDGAISVAILQVVVAVALIFNTIRLTAYARREQTGIMKLVGATNWYIRLPFVLEGIVTGFVGGLLAGVLLLIGKYILADPLFEQIFRFIPSIPTQEVLAMIPLLAVIGMVVSGLAAFVSLRRFLAV